MEKIKCDALCARQIGVAFRVLRSAYKNKAILGVSLFDEIGGVMVYDQTVLADLFGGYSLRRNDESSFYAEHYSEDGVRWYAYLHLEDLSPEDCERLGIDYAG